MIISVWKVLFMTIFFSTNDLVHRDQYLVYNCVYKLPPPLLTQYVDNTVISTTGHFYTAVCLLGYLRVFKGYSYYYFQCIRLGFNQR